MGFPGMPSSEWDRVSDTYSECNNSFYVLHAYDLLKAALSALRRDSPNLSIVDVGCGSGAVAEAYLRLFPRGVNGHTLTSSDFSPGLIEKAKCVVPTTHCDTHFEFRVEDATQLAGTPDCSVDVLLSSFALFVIDDLESVFRQVKRVLKPGGVFAMSAWTLVPDLPKEFGVMFEDVIWKTAKNLCPPDPVMSAMMNYEGPGPDEAPWHKWLEVEGGINILKSAGFDDVRGWRILHSATFETVEQIWRMSHTTPIINLASLEQEQIDQAYKKFKEMLTSNGVDVDGGMVHMMSASNIYLGKLDASN